MFGEMLGTFPSQEHVKKGINVDGLGTLGTGDERALGTREMARPPKPSFSLPQ